MGIDKIILKLLEDQSIMTAISLIITTACGLGVAYLNVKRGQLVDVAKGAKRSSLRSEYLQIYQSTEFTCVEKWKMTRPLVKEYFDELNGNHYIHGLDEKLYSNMIEETKKNDKN